MSRSRRVELGVSGVLVVVCLLIPDLLLRWFWKAPNPRLAGVGPTRSVLSGEPKIITLEPLSCVEKADGHVEATISLGQRVQVVHEGETFEVDFKVAKISSSAVQLVENSARVAEPHLLAETGRGVALAPARKAPRAPLRPAPEAASNPAANRQFEAGPAASVSEPSGGQELGYVERGDGRVEAIIADGEDVRLAPETKLFADNFHAPASTRADLEAANASPPLIHPPDSSGQESQPAQPDSSTQEVGVPPLVASGPESSSAGKPQASHANNGEPEPEPLGIIQSEPLAEYAGSRLQPRDVAPVPQAGLAGPAPSPATAGSGQALKGDATSPLSPKVEGTQPAFSILGYVKQPGGEEEAIVEARGQVHLMHKAELSAEKNRALQGTASSAVAQAMHAPSTARVLQANLGLGAGAMQRIFAVQVGAFKDRSNARRLKERIESQFGPVVIQDFDRGASRFYCVRVGQVSTEDAARELAERLRKANLARETFSVRLK